MVSVSGGDGLSKGAGGAGLSGRRRSGRRALTVARSSSCVLPSPLSLSALCLGRGAHARVGLFGAQGESELKFWVGEIGFDPGDARGQWGSSLRVCGGRGWWSGHHIIVGQHGVKCHKQDVLQRCSTTALRSHDLAGFCPPSPLGLARDTGMGPLRWWRCPRLRA